MQFQFAPRRTAWFLALAGFVPFAGLAAAMALLGPQNPFFPVIGDALRTYAAIILSFLGGIRWGLALRGEPVASADLAFSTVPSVAAWLALFLSAPLSFAVLLLGFCAQGAWDSFAVHRGLAPQWFAPLRMTLTVLVAAALAVAFAASF